MGALLSDMAFSPFTGMPTPCFTQMISGEPRATGDGYCASVMLDPDDNRVEITV
jgi:hypothetical protein